MKQLKYIIPAVAISMAAGTCAAASDDDVISNTVAARALIKDAAGEYNKAVAAILNSDNILRDNISRAANVSGDFLSHQSTSETIVRQLEYAKDKMRLLKENYKQAETAISFARDNLGFANGSFPIGDKRFELADLLYKQGLEIATKNPGKNYEDKRYFEGIWSSYANIKSGFVSNQKEASRLGLTLSIANPRMEGIQATLKLAEDFLGKTSASVDDNKKLTEEMREKVQSLYDESIKSYEDLTGQMQKLAKVRSQFTKANFALSVFIMNELPKYEKYRDTIFNADAAFLNAVRSGGYFAVSGAMDEEMLVGAPSPSNAYMSNISQKQMLGAGASRASADYASPRSALKERATVVQSSANRALASDVMSVPSKPENIRSELFDICLQITNLAAEIAQANALLNDIVSESNASLSAVETSENDVNTLLRSVIGFFSEAQKHSSELQIFKNSMMVSISQSTVSSNEFKKLCESADKAIMACSENTSKSGEKLEAARAALK